LLLSPSLQQACCRHPFSLEEKIKKMGDDNKFVVVALFIARTTKEKNCNNNKLVVVAHFCFKQKEEKNGR
jgi:hypothetical protein